MKPDFSIRKATPTDLKEVQRLNYALFVKEYREYDQTLNTRFPFTKRSKQYFLRRTTKPLAGILIVAESNKKIVGYLCGGLQKRKPSRSRARYAELENMYVKKEFRSRGIGAALIKVFIRWCRGRRIKYVSVITSSKNQRAHKFYRKAGFGIYEFQFLMKLRQ